jgi:hypothetical protein
MASFPGSVKSFTTRNAGDVIQPAHINDLQDEVNAVQATLLTNGGFVAKANGVSFPAAQSASVDANTLDDYEEGSWTPVIGGSGGESGQTYASQIGRYIKIGRQVTVWCDVTLSTKGTITGNVQVSGLPFAADAAACRPIAAVSWLNLATNWVHVLGILVESTSAILLRGAGAAAASADTSLATADIANNTTVRVTLSYLAAA